MAVRRQTLRLAARLIEDRLNGDTSDHSSSSLPCPCGAPARYAGRRWKSFTTALGELRLTRAYYHCVSCGEGFCPRDSALGLEGGCLSPGVTRMVGLVGATVSFEEGSTLLRELAGVVVEAKHVERSAEVLGEEIARDEQLVGEPVPEGDLAPTLYLGLDGTGVPMRGSELVGRVGKQPDGSAKTREVKICTIWSAEARDEQDNPVRDDGSVSYSAAIESAASRDTDEQPSPFAERALREATRRGFDRARRQVVLGDGAPWIWKIAEMHFPDAIQIVDLFHAKQHLSQVAKAVYGPTSPQAVHWAKRRHAELDQGRLGSLLKALSRLAPRSPEARNCIGYFQANRPRMDYPRFRAQKLCVSTAVVEAGCKVVVATRLKRAGMHWTVRGANAILALRACRLSGRFEDFWQRRSQRKAA